MTETLFGLTGLVGQAAGQDISWAISWPGINDQSRFVAVSFQPIHRDTKLERVSEWFSADEHHNPIVGELVRGTGDLINFRFAVVVIVG